MLAFLGQFEFQRSVIGTGSTLSAFETLEHRAKKCLRFFAKTMRQIKELEPQFRFYRNARGSSIKKSERPICSEGPATDADPCILKDWNGAGGSLSALNQLMAIADINRHSALR